jgi:hypothetical protein
MTGVTGDSRRPDWGTWLGGAQVRSARASRDGSRTVNLVSRGSWRKWRTGARRPGHPGTWLIQTAAWMLFALGMGLLAVSFAAQYRYISTERHQNVASVIEAGALDVGMIIFALLALGLARAGLSAKAERGLVVVCAVGSALMNYAAADVSSPRSVLAFCMPPLFLAVVVDRVVVTVRRHVLGMRDARSPWRVLATITLYVLRFVLDPWTTANGLRRCVLTAAPLPAAALQPAGAAPQPKGRKAVEKRAGRPSTKTTRFLRLVEERYGDFAKVPLDQVSRIAAEVAPQVRLDLGSARRELRAAVLAAQPGGAS